MDNAIRRFLKQNQAEIKAMVDEAGSLDRETSDRYEELGALINPDWEMSYQKYGNVFIPSTDGYSVGKVPGLLGYEELKRINPSFNFGIIHVHPGWANWLSDGDKGYVHGARVQIILMVCKVYDRYKCIAYYRADGNFIETPPYDFEEL